MKIVNNRINWIDIAKGLMIIGMVLNHIPNICSKNGLDISSFPWTLTLGHAYGVFTMQSFFVLSGYTSNFKGDLKTFIVKQSKALLFPYIVFSVLCSLISMVWWDEQFWYCNAFGEQWLFLVEGYWFLSALFIAKLLAFMMRRLPLLQELCLGGDTFGNRDIYQ